MVTLFLSKNIFRFVWVYFADLSSCFFQPFLSYRSSCAGKEGRGEEKEEGGRYSVNWI